MAARLQLPRDDPALATRQTADCIRIGARRRHHLRDRPELTLEWLGDQGLRWPQIPHRDPRGPRFGMPVLCRSLSLDKEQGAFRPVAYSRTSLAEKRRSDAELRPKRGIAEVFTL